MRAVPRLQCARALIAAWAFKWHWQVTSGADADEANEQEIFEFPWVVFDVASKHVVDEKAVYVKPTLHEKLGADCAKAALGDDASSMESAGSLQQAVQVRPRPGAESLAHVCTLLSAPAA